jgi:3-isopropylmalate dehydrogenase
MFEYALDLPEAGALIREAVNASIDAGIVTVDIAGEGKASSTEAVGDWLADYVARH